MMRHVLRYAVMSIAVALVGYFGFPIYAAVVADVPTTAQAAMLTSEHERIFVLILLMIQACAAIILEYLNDGSPK